MGIVRIAEICFDLQYELNEYDNVLKQYLFDFISNLKKPNDSNDIVHWNIQTKPFESIVEPKNRQNKAEISYTDDGFFVSCNGGVNISISKDRREVEMFVAEHMVEIGGRYPWVPLSSMLRLFLSIELPFHDGLVFHGSSILDNDVARMFTGVSGAGKSTVSNMAGARPVFNDEITLLQKIDDEWYALPSPFFSNELRSNRINEKAKLGSISLLKQATKHYLQDLNPVEAMPELMGNLMNFMDDEDSAERLLSLVTNLVLACPPQRLHFKKDPEFWRLF